jgi:hypothetical protein
MQSDTEQLQVEVELMENPCLWRWEIRDAARNQVIADSWTKDWAAYESREASVASPTADPRPSRPTA